MIEIVPRCVDGSRTQDCQGTYAFEFSYRTRFTNAGQQLECLSPSERKFDPGPDDAYDSGYREFVSVGTWTISTSLHRFDPKRRLRVEVRVEGERKVVRQIRMPKA